MGVKNCYDEISLLWQMDICLVSFWLPGSLWNSFISYGTARWVTDPSAKRDAQTNECLLISNANPAMRPARWRRSPSLVRRHLYSFDGLFDERSHRIWPRHVDGVTARDLDDCRTYALRHEPLGRWWDHLVVGGNHVPV